MVELTEYEQQRLQNIARNNALLQDLEIEKIPIEKRKQTRKPYKKRKLNKELASRRSVRLLIKPVELKGSIVSSSEEEEEEEEEEGEEEEEEEDESVSEGEETEDEEKKEKKNKKRRKQPKEEEPRRPKKIKPTAKASVVKESEALYAVKQPLPTRDEHGALHFTSHPSFTPNLTPKEILQLGSFGGGYFRPIHSGITGQDYKDDYKEFPDDWFEGLDVTKQITNSEYNAQVNRYKVKAGQGLKEWEASGWIVAQDPRGWFQWYCRFYQGRRSPDDERQISRWTGVAGANGRWKKDLLTKIMSAKKSWDDFSVSPIVRQTLQHWAYQLNEYEFSLY